MLEASATGPPPHWATLRALPSLGEECVIHTRMVVREDAMLLFGFAEREERAAFDALDG